MPRGGRRPTGRELLSRRRSNDAAAVRQRMQALSGMIGRKASVGGFFKSAVKSQGSTLDRRWKLPSWTAGDKPEEGEDDVKSSCPLCPGRHTCYNGRDKGSRSREGELTPKPVLSSDCRLQLACMKPESLVIAGQPYGGEFVPGPCTPPVTLWSWPCPKSLP
ncbi:hypothetical protein H6P81_021508 [Aristolochia fimbriata]|uniref:Uncharacterized protein n=1 Tax=Aristolochia fimbriata TaxID=158543 RepID=A0AAV7DSU6_ARIFI|nr:hypothetical protein H6P81_021508 [Aristolochia fimbriata]